MTATLRLDYDGSLWVESMWRFDVGDIVESESMKGIYFRIVRRTRTYDALPSYDIKFWGQAPDTSPVAKGRVNKFYRIKTLNMLDSRAQLPNPLKLLAVSAC